MSHPRELNSQSSLLLNKERKKKYNFEPRLNEKERGEERAQGFKDLQARMKLGALRKALTPDAVRRLVTENRRNILKPLPPPAFPRRYEHCSPPGSSMIEPCSPPRVVEARASLATKVADARALLATKSSIDHQQ